MIPDWKLEKYLTGDLPASEMRELRELEATDEVFAGRVRMFREDNLAILRKMPFKSLEAKLNGGAGSADSSAPRFAWVKIAAAVVVALGIFSAVFVVDKDDIIHSSETVEIAAGMDVAMADVEDGTRIKGMESRMEIWKKTTKGIVQLENLSDASEGDEIQLRYSVPQKCFGILFSMDGNGTLTMHMGNENKAIALEPGKMVTLPFAYKLDNAPKFEKFFLLTSSSEFELDVSNIDEILKKDGVESKTLTLRKVEGGR